ncbi:MAG: phage/plasmid primase, P4 family [Spirochaetia bacterium]|jgi:putative DNA primase/helicase|nr:phage/plasmid primase, P4 family [Spirochaetia bacterium]
MKPAAPLPQILARSARAQREIAALAADAPDRSTTEAGLAEAVADFYSDCLAFVPDLNFWFVYDGSRWSRDIEGAATQGVKLMLRHLEAAAADAGNLARRAELIAKERAGAIRAILSLAATEPRLVRPLALFDVDPWTLNTPGGLVDLRTGDIAPHDPSQNLMLRTGVAPDFNADAPRFGAFIDSITCSRPDLAAWLVARLGYSLTGVTNRQDFEIRHGGGANGKGVLQNLMLSIFGEYSCVIDPSILLAVEKRGRGPSPELLDTRGRRVIFATETAEGDRLDTGRVKTLTGQDEQAARALFSNTIVKFMPTAKIVLSTNSAPGLDAVDDGMRRRVLLVPFDATFRGSACDPEILDKLKTEGAAILGQLVRSAQVYAATQALPDCPEVNAASAEYLTDVDPIARWIEAKCRVDPDSITDAATLYRSFSAWQIEDGMVHAWTQTRLGRALESHGFPKVEGGHTVRRRGLSVIY